MILLRLYAYALEFEARGERMKRIENTPLRVPRGVHSAKGSAQKLGKTAKAASRTLKQKEKQLMDKAVCVSIRKTSTDSEPDSTDSEPDTDDDILCSWCWAPILYKEVLER